MSCAWSARPAAITVSNHRNTYFSSVLTIGFWYSSTFFVPSGGFSWCSVTVIGPLGRSYSHVYQGPFCFVGASSVAHIQKLVLVASFLDRVLFDHHVSQNRFPSGLVISMYLCTPRLDISRLAGLCSRSIGLNLHPAARSFCSMACVRDFQDCSSIVIWIRAVDSFLPCSGSSPCARGRCRVVVPRIAGRRVHPRVCAASRSASGSGRSPRRRRGAAVSWARRAVMEVVLPDLDCLLHCVRPVRVCDDPGFPQLR